MDKIGRWTISVYSKVETQPFHSEVYFDERKAELGAVRMAIEYPRDLVYGTYLNSDLEIVTFSPGREYGRYLAPDPGVRW